MNARNFLTTRPRSLLQVRPAFTATLAVASAGLLALTGLSPSLRAGSAPVAIDKQTTKNVVAGDAEKVTLNSFETEFNYIGKSEFQIKQFDGDGPLQSQREFGEQDEAFYSAEYTHRFRLFDRVYLKLGAAYARHDFGKTFAPLPTSLQSITGSFGVEYVRQNRPAIFLTSSPGIYFSDINDLAMASFDAPTAVGGILPLGKSVFLFIGVRASILSEYPVFPLLGAVWLINDNLRLELVPPTPRLIYSMGDKLEFFVGGVLAGGTFRRDSNDNARPQDRKFNNAILQYSRYALDAGVTFKPVNGFEIDVSGGYNLRREFNYYRGDADKRFIADGAAFARVALRAKF